MFTGPNIVTNGLVLSLDAANKKSYPGSGTTWYDKSGNNSNGTLTNGPTFSNANAGSIVFNGSNNYIDFGTSGNSLIRTATTLTISSVVYCTGFSNLSGGYQWAPIFAIDKYQLGNSYRKLTLDCHSDNGVQGVTSFYSNGSGVNSSNNYNFNLLNSFLNITSTIDSSSHVLYINGVNVSQSSGIVVNSNPLTSEFTIGARISSGYNGYFKGNIYQALIYNRALTASEVLQNYNATKGRYGL